MDLAFIGPADRADLLRGFEGLSSRSRYLRFFSRMRMLPTFIVDGLVNTDGTDHVAIGARLIDESGHVDPTVVGVARFFRAESGATVAEPSVAVVDTLQGRGLGRLLLRRLTREARAQGITHFRAHALADNARIRRILRASNGTIVEHDGPVLVYDVDIRRRGSRPGRLRRMLGAMVGH
ncbi:MAG: GNAT family N-acetyltransferase [Pseudomonadales bacterium]